MLLFYFQVMFDWLTCFYYTNLSNYLTMSKVSGADGGSDSDGHRVWSVYNGHGSTEPLPSADQSWPRSSTHCKAHRHTHMLSIGDSCSIFCKHSFRPVNVTVYTGTGIYLVTLKNSKGHLIVGYCSPHLLEIQHIQDVQCKVLHISEQM